MPRETECGSKEVRGKGLDGVIDLEHSSVVGSPRCRDLFLDFSEIALKIEKVLVGSEIRITFGESDEPLDSGANF